ncbi:DUF2079 domain-containing protein [Propionibacterium ruminifibrarum]|nr:DUF2079 domain-containing protein [Propionibacterium ruminifibrarum]
MTDEAAHHGQSRRARARAWTDSHCTGLLALMCLLALAAYLTVSLLKYARLGDGMDLTIFDQAIRSLARGEPGYTAMKSPGMSIFGDHWHPIIAVLVPCYWLWDDPRVLLIAQAVCVVWAGWVLGRLAQRRIGAGPALAITAAWLCALGTQSAIIFDFHEVALGLPLLAYALSAFCRLRWGLFWALAASLMLVKEDMCFLVGGLAIALLVRRRIRAGLGLGVFAVAWTAAAVFVVIPRINPEHVYAYLGSLGTVTVEGVQEAGHPAWYGPLSTLGTAAVLLAATGFVAARSALIWGFIGSFAVRALSKNPQHWTTGFHYNLMPMLVACFAFVDAWPRLASRAEALGRTGSRGLRARVVRAWRALALPVVVAVALVSIPAGAVLHDLTGKACGAACVELDEATAMIPAGSWVGADVYLTNHLADRFEVSQWRPTDGYLDDLGKPVDPEWLVLNLETISYENETSSWVQEFLDDPVVRGARYEVRWAGEAIVVLQREG